MIGIVIIRRLFGNGGDGNGDAGDRTAGAGAIACEMCIRDRMWTRPDAITRSMYGKTARN